jgi:hypothetical protein
MTTTFPSLLFNRGQSVSAPGQSANESNSSLQAMGQRRGQQAGTAVALRLSLGLLEALVNWQLAEEWLEYVASILVIDWAEIHF